MFTRISSTLFIISIILTALSGVFQATAAEFAQNQEVLPPEELLAIHKAFQEALSAHDLDLTHSYQTDDAVWDFVPFTTPMEKEKRDAYWEGVFQAFPDFHVTPGHTLVSGNILVEEHPILGTHQGEWMGAPASGNSIKGPHLDIFEFEEDKIKKTTTYIDMANLMVQIGAMPAPEMAELVPSVTLPAPEPTGLSPVDAAKEEITRWNTHDLSSWAKMVHPDSEITIAALGVPMDRDAFIASQEMYFTAFPDNHAEIVRAVDMGDGWVLCENIFSGTQDGPYFGIPPSGNSYEMRSGMLYRFDEDGLLTNLHIYFDNMAVLMQIGAIPSMEPKDYSNVFFMPLASGLNMISLPLEPQTPYTARSFAEEISATTVIKLDEARQQFMGFTLDAPDDGFSIEGGKGYIVNVPESKVVAFTGAAWTNQPPVESAPVQVQDDSAWAFVVSGRILESESSAFAVTVRNIRTKAVATDVVRAGYFAPAFADLNRKPVVQIGDILEVTVKNRKGEIISPTLSYTVTPEYIRQAFMSLTLKNIEIPQKSRLLQNYPNPFNPETWIPYQLHKPAKVVIDIFDMTGQVVRKIELGHREAGYYLGRSRAAHWNGRNDTGEKVASGIYFYQIKADDFSDTRRMLVVK